MIVVHTADSFVKITLAWDTATEDFAYFFIAENMKNDSISEELEVSSKTIFNKLLTPNQIAKYYSLTKNGIPANKDYFSWHNIGVKSLSFTDFAITANEESLTVLKEWLNIDPTVSNLQLYHFLRLLMLEFKLISSIEMRPTGKHF